MRIVAISGSLRTGSSNAALLRAAARLAPADTEVVFYEGLGALPHFNPDLDTGAPPEPVRAWRALLASADAVLISSPEYAHGVPGSLKNALDWVVSSGELSGKPVALLNAALGGGELAQESLAEILRTMDAQVPARASLLSAFVRRKLDPQGNVDDPEIAEKLRGCLDALAEAVRAR